MSLVPFRKSYTPAYRGTFDDFDRLFEGFFRNALTNVAAAGPSLTDLALQLDAGETEKAYIIHADLPGIAEKDLDVTLEDGVLTIAGEKKSETEEDGKSWHRVERSYGSFRRALALPADADENGVSATVKDGVLKIVIAKKPQPQKTARRIDVKTE